MRIVWDAVPGEIKDALAPLIKTWRPIVPTWLDQMTVSFVPTNEDKPECPLSIEPEPEYRIANVFVHGPFLTMSDRSRKSAVFHEIIHVAMDPAWASFYALLNATTDENDPTYALAEEHHRLAMEGAITDLELGLGRLLMCDPHKDGHE